jgi:hypothetical protein
VHTIVSLLFGMCLMLGLVVLHARMLGFRAQKPRDYATSLPRLDLRQHLNGPILCEGVIYGLTGRVSSRFVADFDARWDGNVGVMTETFRYDSGTVQNRQWTLTLGNDGAVRATAPDVVGEGHGRAEGSGVLLNYRLRLTPEAGGHVLNVTDWMYLMENGTIMNRSQFTKFGIKVAELVATMRKKDA